MDFSYVQLSALKAKLGPSLDLFADVIRNPSFPEADFKREQKLQLDAIEQEQKEPFSMALRVFPRLLYGLWPRVRKSFHGIGHYRQRAEDHA